MRALLEDMKSGRVAAYDVPAPELQASGILVRTAFSAISAGTEKAAVEAGRKSLLGKAMSRPDLVKEVIAYAQSNGIGAARRKVQARLETLSALGYSCSGLVLQAGAAVTEFQPGDRVACAGAGYALPDRILPMQQPLRERFVHHGNFRSTGIVVCEIAAGHACDPHGLKVSRCDHIEIHDCVLFFGAALGMKVIPAAVHG